ncbi:MAG: hypothetical protein FJY29_13540 [Betaproteobacteria bacterium]|nr:hypothetical protein [Betaproteobacteria bacterium]
MSRLNNFRLFAVVAFGAGALAMPVNAWAKAVQIVPYAAVSSTKGIKPNKVGKSTDSNTATEETVTQRTTYGLRINVRMSRLFSLQLQGGTNKVDQTRKASAMRDEYGDIDFTKDANVDTSAQDATYKYNEEQRVGQVLVAIQPKLGKILQAKIAAGVRARERFLKVTDKATDKETSIHDPIRYNAVASAGFQARLLKAFSATAEYNFYFLKFPKTEPHEQEVLIGFGFQL